MSPARAAASGGSRLAESLWGRYAATRDPEARVQLLDLYLGLVHHAAREAIRSGGRGAELEELISAGTVGLVQALEGFDPARGLAFSTYAVPRIRGAILDELRSRDWTPRSVRTRRAQLARTRAELQQRLGRAPSDEETARALGVELETLWAWERDANGRVRLELDADRPGEGELRLAETIPDPAAPAPDDGLLRGETLEGLRRAIAELPGKDRLVLSL